MMNYILKNPIRIEKYIEFYGKKNSALIFDKVSESLVAGAIEETQHFSKNDFYRNQKSFIFMFNTVDDPKIPKLSNGVAVIPYIVVLDDDSQTVGIYID